MDSSRNMWECFCVQGLEQFVGYELVCLNQLHAICKILSLYT